MDKFLREIKLDNGLAIKFTDQTRHYYDAFYLVKLVISFDVPICRDQFDSSEEYETALSLLGDRAVYRRSVEQMGVLASEIDRTLLRLTDSFLENSLNYISRATFPKQFVLSELSKTKRKRKATLLHSLPIHV